MSVMHFLCLSVVYETSKYVHEVSTRFLSFSQEVQHKVLKYFQLKPKVNSLRSVYEVSE